MWIPPGPGQLIHVAYSSRETGSQSPFGGPDTCGLDACPSLVFMGSGNSTLMAHQHILEHRYIHCSLFTLCVLVHGDLFFSGALLDHVTCVQVSG